MDAASHNYPLGIADRNNHRVLFFANDGNAVADRVYGQLGSFTAHIANNNGAGNSGGPSANNLTNPTGVALDSKGGIFVNDRDNHRVLHFPKGVTTAGRVYGQFGSFQGAMTNNDGGGNYGEPSVDKDDGLYVSDATNHRVLYFANDGDTTADRVYGQWDNMTTGLRNSDGNGRMGGPNARSLNFPRGLAVDTFGGTGITTASCNSPATATPWPWMRAGASTSPIPCITGCPRTDGSRTRVGSGREVWRWRHQQRRTGACSTSPIRGTAVPS